MYFNSVATKINEFIRKDTDSPALNLNSDIYFTFASEKENVSEMFFSLPGNEVSFTSNVVDSSEQTSNHEEMKNNVSTQRYPVSFIIMGILVVVAQFISAFAVFYYYSHSSPNKSPINNPLYHSSPESANQQKKVLELPSLDNGGMREINFPEFPSNDLFVQIQLSSTSDLCLQQGKSMIKSKNDNPFLQIYNAIPSMLYSLSLSPCKSNLKR
jgi:hypothetical protein